MKTASRLEARIRDIALAYPEATEEFPWGERAIKVKGKVFLFMRGDRDRISLSVKLPRTRFQALALPGTEPTGYGLGRSGWVTAKFSADDGDMLEQCREWIDESWCAVAPKRLVALRDSAVESKAAGQAPATAKASASPAPKNSSRTAPSTRTPRRH